MTKRVIRLKEYPPGSDQMCVPSADYLSRTDGSLTLGPFRCRSDNDGFIETGNVLASPSKTVVFLGGSFVESIYCPEDERFVSATERLLAESGHSVRCLNGGYSGSTTLQLLNVMLNKVYPLVGPGGSVVVFGPHSDRDYLYKQGSYWSNTQRGATILPPGELAHPDVPRGIGSAEMVLRILVSTAQQLGLNLILATSPYREGEYESDPLFALNYHGRRDWFRAGMLRRRHWISLIHRVAMETGTPLIDVQGVVNGDPQFFYDELHLNTEGQRLVANHLSKAIPGLV